MNISFSSLLQEGLESVTVYHGSPYNFNSFDVEKVGSGDGLSKYGWGLYFTDNKKLAISYAKDLTLKMHEDGFNLYTVRLIQPSLLDWDNTMEHWLFNSVIRGLNMEGLEDEVEEFIEENNEEYGYNLWTGRELYEWLETAVGGKKEASKFLLKYAEVDGFITKSDYRDGTIYTIFNDEIIKILNKEKI